MRLPAIALAAATLAVVPATASAHTRHHHRHHVHASSRSAHESPRVHDVERPHWGGEPEHFAYDLQLVTAATVAGPIRVAASAAQAFVRLIASFAAAGYHPRHVGCYAAHGHIRHSLHHVGLACDFDQTGWNRTARFMYTPQAHALIAQAGLRDGCDFRSRRDCGHVDVGSPLRLVHHQSLRKTPS
jgi:hypothetical protein